MLRAVKTSRLGIRVTPFRYTTASGSPVIEQGADDIASTTDHSAGNTSVVFKDLARRVCVAAVSGSGDGGATGVAASLVSAPTVSTVRALLSDAAGAGAPADGTVDGLLVASDSSIDHSVGPGQSVKCTNIGPRIVALRLTGPSTVVEGKSNVTVTAASNVSTIVIKNPFQEVPIVLTAPDVAGNTIGKVSATSHSIVVEQFSTGDVAATDGMHILIVGQDHRGRIGRLRRTLRATQMRPRLLAGIVAQSGGDYSIASAYSDLGTVTKNGTGDVTITFERAFLRAPVVIPTIIGTAGTVAVTETSATACRIVVKSFANVAADPTGLSLVILGFDYSAQG